MTARYKLPSIIGLYSPFPRMGKSTVARFLAENFGYIPLKFAGPVKNPLYEMGLTEEDIESDLKEQPHPALGNLTPREKMHEISQALFRDHGKDYLAQRLKVDLDKHLRQGQRVVIDDVRFPENTQLIRQYAGAEIWRVFSSLAATQSAYDTSRLETHPFDLRLNHAGNSQELQAQIRQHIHQHPER